MQLSSIKNTIPWWSKIIGKIVLSRLPASYHVWQRLDLFRHGCMDKSNYAFNVFMAHVDRGNIGNQLSAKTILELGPGDSVGTAVVSACYGARAILVDSGKYAVSDIQVYQKLAEELSLIGLEPPDISDAVTLNDILTACGATYHTLGLNSLKSIETDSIDFIFSQAVLEHVRECDFLDTMRECRRTLADGGVASHRVDLKDHLGGGLNNLRFGNGIWESNFFVNSGFYTNRIRLTKMIELCQEAGFEVELNDVRRWEKLPLKKNKLAKEFRMLSDEELCVSGFDMILR